MEEKELENALIGVGNRILHPPSNVDELLPILDKAETLLSLVEQSPSQSMSSALNPALKGLTTKKLLGHPDADVRVHVAACISEITRITAPEAPYDDNKMKDIFKIMVESFEKLDDFDNRSYSKRVSILETAANVRSCVVMLDLECDALILAMFSHFLRTIRDKHPESVISSMETIMTVVIEESEDISPDLLSSLLLNTKKDGKKKDAAQTAKKLAEKVILNCGSKLKPSLIRAVQALGAPLDSYGEIIRSLCRESSDLVNDVANTEEQPKGSEEVDKSSNSCRPEQICTDDSSSGKKGTGKSSDMIINGSKARDSGPEESASRRQSCPPGKKNKLKETIDGSSGLGRHYQICADDSLNEKKGTEISSSITINGNEALESGRKKSVPRRQGRPLGKKNRSKEGADEPKGLSRPDNICADGSSSEKKGTEKSPDNGSKALEIGPKESTLHRLGRLPGKMNGPKESIDGPSGLIRVDQICIVNSSNQKKESEKSSEVTMSGNKAQESGTEESACRGRGRPQGKKIESKKGIDVLSGPVRSDQICTVDSSSQRKESQKSSKITVSGNKSQENGADELADRGQGRLPGKKKGSKKGFDVLSGAVRADQIFTDDSSSQKVGLKSASEKSSEVTIRSNKTRESGAEELADRGQGRTPGKKKGMKKSIDVLSGPVRADQIFVDDSSSKKKNREQSSEITISGNKTQESGAEELADGGQGRLRGKKKGSKKGISVLSGAIRADQIYTDGSSSQKKESEKSSEVTISGNKVQESGAEELADHGQCLPPGKKKGSKKSTDVLSGPIRADQICVDDSSSKIKGREQSSEITISGNKTRESGAEESSDRGQGRLRGKKKGSKKGIDVLSGAVRSDQIYKDDSSSQKKESEKSSEVTISGHKVQESGAEELADRGQGRLPGKKKGSKKSTDVLSGPIRADQICADDSSSKNRGREQSSEITIIGNKTRESGAEELADHGQGRLPGKKNGSKKSIDVHSGAGSADQVCTDDSSSKKKGREQSSKVTISGNKVRESGTEELAHHRQGRLLGQKNGSKERIDVPSWLDRADQTCTVDSSSKRKEREKSSETAISGNTSGESGAEELAHRRRRRLLGKKNGSKESIDVPGGLGRADQTCTVDSSSKKKEREKSSEITIDGNEAQERGPKELPRRGRGRPPGKKNRSKESIAGPIGLSSADQIGTDYSSIEKKGRKKSSDISINGNKAQENDTKESTRRGQGRPSGKKNESKERSREASSSPMQKRSREEEGEVAYDESLVGAKIKVWWPDDKIFYRGVIDSYDPSTMKHKVLYVDGDEEDLFLKNEFFKFLKDCGLKGDWTPAKRSKVERNPPASDWKQTGRANRSSTRNKPPRKSSPSS